MRSTTIHRRGPACRYGAAIFCVGVAACALVARAGVDAADYETAPPVPSMNFLEEIAPLRPVGGQAFSEFAMGDCRKYYAFAEVLAFQRDNEACNTPLVTDTVSGGTLLSVSDLNPSMAIGGRAFVGVRRAGSWGYEAGYFGVYGMTAQQSLAGAENLQLAGPLNTQVLPFQGADSVTATYISNINSAEFNIFKSCCNVACCTSDPCNACCNNGCCIDWLGGFRYVSVEEQAGMTFTCCTTQPLGPFTSNYNVQTSNNLLGGQFGGRARRDWKNWAVEGWAKTGVFANLQSQSQGAIIDPTGTGTVVRDARSSSGVAPAMMADLNLSVIYRISRVWGIRAGYNAIWIGGVALAPNQWDFSTANPDAGTTLVPNGGVFLNGANLGLEARW